MITFRAIEQSDLGMLKTWRNQPTVMPHVREYRMLSDTDQNDWFEAYKRSRRVSDWGQEIMIVQHRGTDIGVGGFTRIQWKNRLAELTFYIGSDMHRDDAIIKSCLIALLDKGFADLCLNKITWPVYAHNPYLKVYKEIFREEAVLRQEYAYGNQLLDRHYLSLTYSEYIGLVYP